jgi:hypothetical protein
VINYIISCSNYFNCKTHGVRVSDSDYTLGARVMTSKLIFCCWHRGRFSRRRPPANTYIWCGANKRLRRCISSLPPSDKLQRSRDALLSSALRVCVVGLSAALGQLRLDPQPTGAYLICLAANDALACGGRNFCHPKRAKSTTFDPLAQIGSALRNATDPSCSPFKPILYLNASESVSNLSFRSSLISDTKHKIKSL